MAILRLLRQHGPTLSGCTLVTLLTSQRYFGFVRFMLGPLLAIWLLGLLCASLWKPELRLAAMIRAGLWLCAALIAFIAQRHYFIEARHHADQLLARVEQYRQRHGDYPASAKAMGIEPPPRGSPHTEWYAHDAHGPFLFYLALYIPFDIYAYDFDRRQWVYEAQ